IAWIFLVAPALLRAGVNTWTKGLTLYGQIVATDPFNPHVVYAAGYDGDLYRSDDGGRSWTRVGSFNSIESLLVSPTSPSTVYLGANRSEVLKSGDRGVTWNQTPINDAVSALAASTTSPSTLYAGTPSGGVYRSVDGGDQWGQPNYLKGSPDGAERIAALVTDPKNDATIYAGALEPFFSKSTDGGATWADLSDINGPVKTIAIDPANSSTLFAGTAYLVFGRRGGYGAFAGAVFRSGDGGITWSPAGLSAYGAVNSLVIDPHNPSTLYAGTDGGVYQTRDAGATWVPFGQQLIGLRTRALALDASGRFLHAATWGRAFDLEIGEGALDVSSGAAGQNRVLFWGAGRLSVRTLDESGNWTSTPFEGPFSGWTATAISDGADGLSRVLWQNGDGRVGLEIVGPSGSQAAFRFVAEPLWTAIDVSVGVDGQAHVLWTSAIGETFIQSVDSSGLATPGQRSGPYAGWSTRAIADGPDGATWVLWRRTDGTAGVSRSKAGEADAAFRWAAIPGWTVEDLAVASDGLPRILWTNPDGRMAIWSVDAQGRLTDEKAYSSAGLEARRIAASSDGLTRVLWSAADGSGALWLFNPDNSLNSQQVTPGP
ncbi:MAG: hypothetical protein ABI968_14560, partial [Acidobacteriota bacterium]